MRISDWSSDVCSSDLAERHHVRANAIVRLLQSHRDRAHSQIAKIRCGTVRIRTCEGEIDARGVAVGPARRPRSEERRVGKECVSTCRSRWSPALSNKKTIDTQKSRNQ